MKEEAYNIQKDSYFLSDCISPEELSEENIFQAKPENIFGEQNKDISETQLSTKILSFPFALDSYQLITLKNKEDPELGGPECKIILGDLEKIRYKESILKLQFFSKDRTSPLNLNDFPNEMKSLINLDIEFISINQNKLFIQCENECSTIEAYTSLQKSSTVFDLLYDEERSINSLDEQNKGINSLLNSDIKANTEQSNENILSSDKKEKKINKNIYNKFDIPIEEDKKINGNEPNFNYKEANLFFSNDQKNIWNFRQNNFEKNNNNNLNVKKSQNTPPKNQINQNIKQESNQKPKVSPIQNPPLLYPPPLFPPILLPSNNLQKTTQSQMNPSLMFPIQKLNPFILQTAIAIQNIITFQQLNQKNGDNKDKKILFSNNLNNIKNFNGKNCTNFIINNNINMDAEKYTSSTNNKESSTNSNTSSTSSKESSPSSNYQAKNNTNNSNNNINNNNFSFPNFNFGLFNGFNINNATPFQNSNLNNNNFKNNNLSDSDSNKIDSTKKTEEKNNFNLEQIVLNKQYKEYIPKNNLKDKDKEKGREFHTNSTRDYQYKYVSRYIVQIENEKNFPVTKMIIGNNGKLLRDILFENCISYGDHSTKIRLRGKGSGYKEGPKNEESKDPMELCISSLNMLSYLRCSSAIENLLLHVYYQYYLYQVNNSISEKKDKTNIDILNDKSEKKEINDKNGCPIIMKKILKYQYVVNRYNTLVKEEKRRKKEEELKNTIQNKTYNDNNDNEYNHV